MERKTFLYGAVAAMTLAAAGSMAQVTGSAGAHAGTGASGNTSLGATNVNGTGTASGGLGLGVDAGINPTAGIDRMQGVVDDTRGTVRSTVGTTTGKIRNTVRDTTTPTGRVGVGAGASGSVTY